MQTAKAAYLELKICVDILLFLILFIQCGRGANCEGSSSLPLAVMSSSKHYCNMTHEIRSGVCSGPKRGYANDNKK